MNASKLCVPLAFLAAGAASAAISINTTSWNNGNGSGTYDASSYDKLVVVVSGEHGFGGNNDDQSMTAAFYDGVSMTPVIQYEGLPEATGTNDSPDQLHHHLYYLDNPSTSTGSITFTSTLSRLNVVVFGLLGTQAGVGNLVEGGNSTDSVNLTTSAANSLVIASIGVGGNGNTGQISGITADSPLTLGEKAGDGRYAGIATGTYINPTASSGTYGFSGYNSGGLGGADTLAVEFLDAAAVPEPSSIALLGLGALGLLIRRRR